MLISSRKCLSKNKMGFVERRRTGKAIYENNKLQRINLLENKELDK